MIAQLPHAVLEATEKKRARLATLLAVFRDANVIQRNYEDPSFESSPHDSAA